MTRHLVSISGGKDSCAMALGLMEFEPQHDYEFIIAPTGNELPEMFEHWVKLQKLLKKKFIIVSKASLQGEIIRQMAIPNHRQRWCTRSIKLEPLLEYQRQAGEVVSYVGLRADEPSRTGAIFEPGSLVQVDFPLRRWGWGIDKVLSYLIEKDVVIPRRTDCAWCFWQKLGEWYELWRDHPDIYAEGERMENVVSGNRLEDYSFRSPSRDSWPHRLSALRLEFEKGRVPTLSLKKMEDSRRNVGTCRTCTL